jgi:Caleosin related protein
MCSGYTASSPGAAQLLRAHRDKHGSDSETYDTEGRMVPQKLEEFFSKCVHCQRLLTRSAAAVLPPLFCCDDAMLLLHLTVCTEQEGNAICCHVQA